MNKLAYSYLRFSTPGQTGGDSRRRQLDLTVSYVARHVLVLDAGLSFRDLGMLISMDAMSARGRSGLSCTLWIWASCRGRPVTGREHRPAQPRPHAPRAFIVPG